MTDFDGIKMTRDLNTIREAVTREQLRINATSLALGAIGGYMVMRRELQDDMMTEEIIKEMIEHHVNSCKNLLLRMEYQEKRVQSQTTVVSPLAYMQQVGAQANSQSCQVYQFMAQRDSNVMMELAAGSKRDSSAMKTISILGMLFLPGTFVAVSPVHIEVFDIREKLIVVRLSSLCQFSTGMKLDLL